jgi:hypothetical protein
LAKVSARTVQFCKVGIALPFADTVELVDICIQQMLTFSQRKTNVETEAVGLLMTKLKLE